MLVFRMDTTGLFRYGQKRELRILFPRENKNILSGTKTGGASGSSGNLSTNNNRRYYDSQSNLLTSSSPTWSTTTSNNNNNNSPRRRRRRKHSVSRSISPMIINDRPPSGGGHYHHHHHPISSREGLLMQPSTKVNGGILKTRRNRASPMPPSASSSPPEDSILLNDGDDYDSCYYSRTITRTPEDLYSSSLSSKGSPRQSLSSVSGMLGPPVPPMRRRTKVTKRLSDQSGASIDDSGQGLVGIRIIPDECGKYGFNVKGGSDQHQPVLVSKVAPGTPADKCYPRLNEGDQVLYINGIDISPMSHYEVVDIIRNAHLTSPARGLVLKVKQNVYEADGLDEPSFQYVPEILPESASNRGTLNSNGGALDESMLLLSEALESGSLVAQFEQLYRRKPGLSVLEARKPENEKKNRYRDISPYDSTRVVLKSSASGNYINASYVSMKIPGSAIVNHYIASQGPLSSTSLDFWTMIWEQKSTLVVMLTTVIEQGRMKCHQYWPKLNESTEFGHLKISCIGEEAALYTGFSCRDLKITNNQTKEERLVTHMQYFAWPDHGVPDDSTEFLNFVKKVREARRGTNEPTIVHCSAGIGRTGVLILMETAQCLIEANEPVYPLDIVREMRDQRAMMIQTASQYRFVCEAIERVYNDGMVQPLSSYDHR